MSKSLIFASGAGLLAAGASVFGKLAANYQLVSSFFAASLLIPFINYEVCIY